MVGGEVGEGEVLHDEEGDALAEVEVECVVLDDGGVAQVPDVDEVLLELKDVLLVHRDDLHSVYFLRLLVFATVHPRVGALSDHLQQYVLLVECVQSAPLLLLVLVRVLPKQALRQHALRQLQTLPPETDLLLLCLHLQAVLRDELECPQRFFNALDLISSLLSLIHYYSQNL